MLFYRQNGVLARCRFGTEHDRIGPVKHGVGNVIDFGAGGAGGVNHAFQHLRGYNLPA